MSWLSEFVRPKISSLGFRKEPPEHFWTKCSNCEAMLFHRDLAANQQVCTVCGHHMRLDVTSRLKMLFDESEYALAELPSVPVDPLKFRDRKKYTDRLKEAQHKSGRSDALVLAHGRMGGRQTVVAAFDFAFMGGSMGIAVGQAIVRGAELAVAQQAPYVIIPASGGARMQEGVLSLMQMPRTIAALQKVREAGLPCICVLTDPTTGGVSASFAQDADIHLAEPGATIGFAGARVIQETIRESLPEGFQRAEYLLEHGMVDQVVERHQLRQRLIQIADLILTPGPGGEIVHLPERRGRASESGAGQGDGATAPAPVEAAPEPAHADSGSGGEAALATSQKQGKGGGSGGKNQGKRGKNTGKSGKSRKKHS